MSLELVDIDVRIGGNDVLTDVSLAVDDEEVVAVLGPSGSGKTTLLRVIAGLQPPSRGRVLVDGRDVTGVPTHRRGVGLMFQDHALFPHRDVAGNVAFGLRRAGEARADRQRRVDEVLELVGLTGFGRRSVASLSGGERQRVALARALAPRPSILLLDEPLGALDRALRDRLLDDLASVLRRSHATVVHVTHDQAEAFATGDRVVVIRAGRIAQVGRAEELWLRPVDADIARIVGPAGVVPVTVERGDRVVAPWGTLEPGRVVLDSKVVEGPAELVLRPDSLDLVERPEAASDQPVPGRVVARAFRGDHVLLRVALDDVDGGPVEIPVVDRHDVDLVLGDPVALRLISGVVVPPAG